MIAQYKDNTAEEYFDSSEQDKLEDKKRRVLSRLDREFRDGESADKSIFSEMRSNILIVAGDHYTNKDNLFNRRVRDNRDLSENQKIRLTKNHVRRICQLYSNNAVATGINVGFAPKDESSLKDQKKAELFHAVWIDAWNKYSLNAARYRWIDSFFQIGEIHVKIQYEDNTGDLLGYQNQVDENGVPVLDEFGSTMIDENRPVFGGRFLFKELYGFNVIRPAGCSDFREAEWLCVREMVDVGLLKKQFPQFKDLLKPDSSEQTMHVFDSVNGGLQQTTNQVLVKEWYYRPSVKYPRGQYIFTCGQLMLAQGDLPGGIFPIVSTGCDDIPTTPRGRSPIKQMRPYQVEINRSASKMAEHQVTLGDDKLLIQNGTKISASASLPGIRGVSYTGAMPEILPGRSGEQYLNYMLSQITELYKVMGLPEDLEDAPNQNTDPYTLLYRSASKKKVFQRYIMKIEEFMIKVVKTYIALAKIHLPDDAIISAVGKNEAVNIAEFKESDDGGYDVKIEPQSDDIESKFGKQMAINHALQYVGNQLTRDDIGKLMTEMPFANFKGIFSDFMLDSDTMTNEILQLDRGEQPPVAETDNHEYAIKRLTARMKQPDFKLLDPQIQMAYQQKLQVHSQIEAFQKEQLRRAEQGFIPTSGPLVRCDVYVPDPNSPTGKSMRMEVPNDALMWLFEQYKLQGVMLNRFNTLPQSAQVIQAEMLNQNVAEQPQQPASMTM